MMQARRDVDVDADVLVGVRRDRLRVDAAGGDRCERGDGHGDAFTEARGRGQAFGRAQLRVGQRPLMSTEPEIPAEPGDAIWIP